MKKDDIRTMIVVIIISIICLVIGLIFSYKSNFDKLDSVSEYSVYFSQIKYINNYINYIANEDSVGVYNLLDKRYIERNNISYSNVLDYVSDYPQLSSFKARNMKYVKLSFNITLYYVTGEVYKNDIDGEVLVDESFSVVIVNDFDNMSFSIYPVDSNYKTIINGIKKKNIDNNSYNNIVSSELIDKEQVCLLYFSDFVNMLFFDIGKAYDYLSDDMKNSYKSLDEFNTYINSNNYKLSTSADKCRNDQKDDKVLYTVIDDKGNQYKFIEESVMDYKVTFYLK